MSRPLMEIDLLRCFVVVAERGGFTAAGEALGLTQAAVSQKVKRLEEAVGRRVFERSSRTVALTAEGEVLMGYARRMLELHEEAARRVAAMDAEGAVRLGVAEYVAPRRLPALLTAFARAHPRMRIETLVANSTELFAAFDAGGLDLVAARSDGDRPGRFLYREPLLWAAAQDWRCEPEAPLPLCLMSAPCRLRDAALTALDAAGRPWCGAYTSRSLVGVQHAVMAGLGASLLPASMIGPELRLLRTEESPPAAPDLDIMAYGADAAGGGQTMIRPLLAFLVERLSELARAA